MQRLKGHESSLGRAAHIMRARTVSGSRPDNVLAHAGEPVQAGHMMRLNVMTWVRSRPVLWPASTYLHVKVSSPWDRLVMWAASRLHVCSVGAGVLYWLHPLLYSTKFMHTAEQLLG